MGSIINYIKTAMMSAPNTGFKKIDPKLAGKGFKNISRVFVCQKCFMIPVFPYQCINENCEKFTCSECIVGNQKCNSCHGNMSRVLKKVKKVLNLIKFKCPNSSKGCTSIECLKRLKQHVLQCETTIDGNKNRNINDNEYLKYEKLLNQKTQRKEKFPNMNDTPEIYNPPNLQNNNISSLNSIFPKPKKAKVTLKKMGVDETMKMTIYQNNTKEELRCLLENYGLPISGNKEELLDRLLNNRTKNFTDEQLKRMVQRNTLEILLNDELEQILKKRYLKKGGNKDEKIKNLMRYLASK
jgi:hypothetical protein